MINNSKKSAEETRKEIVDQAHSEAEKILERARQEIDISKEAAIADIKKYALDLSFAAAQKVTGESLSKDQHLNLIEKSLEELE